MGQRIQASSSDENAYRGKSLPLVLIHRTGIHVDRLYLFVPGGSNALQEFLMEQLLSACRLTADDKYTFVHQNVKKYTTDDPVLYII